MVVTALCFWTKLSHTISFWIAFVLVRPLGAAVGDFLDKPVEQADLGLSGLCTSPVLLAFIALCLLLIPQRPAPARYS